MSHFYGEVIGHRNGTTRTGTKNSGMFAHIRGWHVGAIVKCFFNEKEQKDAVSIVATSGSDGRATHEVARLYETEDGGVSVELLDEHGAVINRYTF